MSFGTLELMVELPVKEVNNLLIKSSPPLNLPSNNNCHPELVSGSIYIDSGSSPE